MKTLSILLISSFIPISFSSDALRSSDGPNIEDNLCQKKVKKLRRRVGRLEDKLWACEDELAQSGQGELRALRKENKGLREQVRILEDENEQLEQELSELRGDNKPPFHFCASGCKKSDGKVDLQFLGSGVSEFLIKAENDSYANVKSKYTCTFGIKKAFCDQLHPFKKFYCTVACKMSDGSADTSYMVGDEGRSLSEAKYNATLKLKKKYSCTFGAVVSRCSK